MPRGPVGPPGPLELAALYPAAEISASTFDAFFAAANRPEVKAALPLVTAEIEDAWAHGVPSPGR